MVIANTGNAAVDHLIRTLRNVTQNGNQYSACCPVPAHDDQNRSFSFSPGDAPNRVKFSCKAGCTSDAIKTATGLTRLKQSNQKIIVATYPYRDECGKLLFEKVRFQPKGFLQRAPTEGGGWIWNLKGVRIVPYRYPELLAAETDATIFIVEGEKDADRLAALGFVVTTNNDGAAPVNAGCSWKSTPEFRDPFKGREVVIIPDNDDAGRRHARGVAQKLRGIASSIRIVTLPGVPEKGDASDYFNAGHTADEFAELVEHTPLITLEDLAEPATSPIVAAIASGEPLSLLNPADHHGRTDQANAARFAASNRNAVRYCGPWKKWLAWDGKRWIVDQSERVIGLAKESVNALWRIGLTHSDEKIGRAVCSFAASSASRQRIEAAVSLARSEPGMAILPDQLDSDPMLLNCLNGTLDLKTGELREHRQSDLITKLCPTEYHADAETYEFDRFMESTIPIEGHIAFLRRYFGYCLTGLTTEQILLILFGHGANGKSTLINAILSTVGGDYTTAGAPDLLIEKRGNEHPCDVAELFGRRLVICSETEDGRRIAEGRVKQLTGGDVIAARRMREDFWNFRPTHKFAMLTNHKPTVRGTDHGIWRRLALIPFDQKFWNPDAGETGPEELKRDNSLPQKLANEAKGILAWAVRGCLEWQRDGLKIPESVKAATEQYRIDEDSIGQFLRDCCVQSVGLKNKASNLYEAYEAWATENGIHPVQQRKFGQRMTAAGLERFTCNGTWYRGIEVRSEYIVGNTIDYSSGDFGS